MSIEAIDLDDSAKAGQPSGGISPQNAETVVGTKEAANSTVTQPPSATSGVKRRDAIASLYARHAESLLTYLKRLVGTGPPDPEDVLQEAFTKIAKAENFDQIKAPHAFLWRTAQNIITNEYRSTAVRERHVDNVADVFYSKTGDVSDPQHVLVARGDAESVLNALEQMDPRRREVVLMNRVDGMTLTEIARRLNVSRSAVSKRLSRAMVELYDAVNQAAD